MVEENTHVFIVRFWREPREVAGTRPEWRGVIEHVNSNEVRYVRGLNEVVTFIAARIGMERGQRDGPGYWIRRFGAWVRRMLAARLKAG